MPKQVRCTWWSGWPRHRWTWRRAPNRSWARCSAIPKWSGCVHRDWVCCCHHHDHLQFHCRLHTLALCHTHIQGEPKTVPTSQLTPFSALEPSSKHEITFSQNSSESPPLPVHEQQWWNYVLGSGHQQLSPHVSVFSFRHDCCHQIHRETRKVRGDEMKRQWERNEVAPNGSITPLNDSHHTTYYNHISRQERSTSGDDETIVSFPSTRSITNHDHENNDDWRVDWLSTVVCCVPLWVKGVVQLCCKQAHLATSQDATRVERSYIFLLAATTLGRSTRAWCTFKKLWCAAYCSLSSFRTVLRALLKSPSSLCSAECTRPQK